MTRTKKRAGRGYLAALIGGVVGGVLGVMSVSLLFETWGAQSAGASVIAGLLAYPLIGFGIAGGITTALTLRKHSDAKHSGIMALLVMLLLTFVALVLVRPRYADLFLLGAPIVVPLVSRWLTLSRSQ